MPTELADEGFRVLALSAAEVRDGADWESADQRLLGLVAMNDPAKPAARTTIEDCRAAGIVPVLITGDHPATARAVALRVGILTPEDADREGSVVTGPPDRGRGGGRPDRSPSLRPDQSRAEARHRPGLEGPRARSSP